MCLKTVVEGKQGHRACRNALLTTDFCLGTMCFWGWWDCR